VIVKTGRFGQLTVSDEEIIEIPGGVLGFPEYKKFALVDAADETLILWLQSLDNPEIAFPVLEPKIFRADYSVRLSAAELRELKLENINKAAVFSILTIPSDVTQMTANLKAPIVINLSAGIAKQVVLQENEYNIKQPMFKELRQHLITIQSQAAQRVLQVGAVAVKTLPASQSVKSLQA
jgi:flagellar assembly factor FliW